MPRGGKRRGTPGKAYGNRTDLQRAEFTGQQYGERVRQIRAQQAVPVRPPQTPSGPGGESAAAPVPQGTPPGSLGPLTAPSQRPGEPITAGLGVGPGPGPEALAMGGGDGTLHQLRAIYLRFPDEELRALIERMETQGG